LEARLGGHAQHLTGGVFCAADYLCFIFWFIGKARSGSTNEVITWEELKWLGD
jgi:hypothetical protein